MKEEVEIIAHQVAQVLADHMHMDIPPFCCDTFVNDVTDKDICDLVTEMKVSDDIRDDVIYRVKQIVYKWKYATYE